MNAASEIQEFEIQLGMMMLVKRPSILSISGIGSCVALAMRDSETSASGLAHIVLPSSTNMPDAYRTPGKYSDTAVRTLIKGLLRMGAVLDHVTAKLVGGARVLQSGGFDGSRNVECTRNELASSGVSVAAQDVGQTYGRTIKFDTSTGKILVRRFQQISGRAELKDVLII